MTPIYSVLLKPLYLLSEKELRSARLDNVAYRHLAAVRPVGRIISVRCVGTSREAIGIPSRADIVKVGHRTAEDFQSTRLIARALRVGAKKGGINIVLRNPATGELCTKIVHAKVPEGLTSYTVVNICAKKIYQKFGWALNRYMHFNKHQLRWPPGFKNGAGQDYLSLPTIAKVTTIDNNAMLGAQMRLISGGEIVQMDNKTGYDFHSAFQVLCYLKSHTQRGVKIVIRNPRTEELYVKLVHASLLSTPSMYATVRIQPVKPDRAAYLLHNWMYIHHNEKQLRWSKSYKRRAALKYGNLRPIAEIPVVEHVALVGKKIKQGTEIVQIGRRTAGDFVSKGHVARVLIKAAKRGVKVILRNPATGALDAKIVHSGKLAYPAPYTHMKLRIKEVVKSDELQICLYAQHKSWQLYKIPTRFDSVNRIWRSAMQPIGKIESMIRVGYETGEKLRMVPGAEILQIGKITSKNFLSTRHIMESLVKRVKRGIDIMVRDPVTGRLDRKIFCTQLVDDPCPYTLVQMKIKMPLSWEPRQYYVSSAGTKQRRN